MCGILAFIAASPGLCFAIARDRSSLQLPFEAIRPGLIACHAGVAMQANSDCGEVLEARSSIVPWARWVRAGHPWSRVLGLIAAALILLSGPFSCFGRLPLVRRGLTALPTPIAFATMINRQHLLIVRSLWLPPPTNLWIWLLPLTSTKPSSKSTPDICPAPAEVAEKVGLQDATQHGDRVRWSRTQ